MRNSVVLKREEGVVFIGTDDGRVVAISEGRFGGDDPGDIVAFDVSEGRWESVDEDRFERFKALMSRGDLALTHTIRCPDGRTAWVVATWASDLRAWVLHSTLIG